MEKTNEAQVMPADLEQVYDEQINPLMAQIIAICTEHKMPMVASFQYEPESYVTTALPFPGCSDRFKAAVQLIYNGFTAFSATRRD